MAVVLTCIPADLVTTSGVTRGLGSGPGDTSAGRPGFLPLQKMVATNLSRGFVVFCAASVLSIIISFNGFFSDQHEDIGHKHVAVSGSFICFAAMWLAAIFGLLAVELPDSCVNFSDRKKKVGIFMLILLCAQRPSAEASESRWTGRASGYPSTFRNTYPKSEGRPPGTSAREPSFFHAAFQMGTIRLRGGAGEGTVIYEKVIHHVKGAAVKAKASKKRPPHSAGSHFLSFPERRRSGADRRAGAIERAPPASQQVSISYRRYLCSRKLAYSNPCLAPDAIAYHPCSGHWQNIQAAAPNRPLNRPIFVGRTKRACAGLRFFTSPAQPPDGVGIGGGGDAIRDVLTDACPP